MRSLGSTIVAGIVTASGSAMAQSGAGLAVPGDQALWSRWQSRVTISTSVPSWRADLARAGDTSGLKIEGASLVGDFYFARLPLGARGIGGFRASSGLVVFGGAPLWAATLNPLGGTLALGQRSSSLPPADPGADAGATLPYLGVGYSGLSGRGGWGFAADVGVVAQGAGLRFGRMLAGSQSLDEVLRDLRLTPLLQLGVSYSF